MPKTEIKSPANSKLKQFKLLQKKKYREKYSLVPLEGAFLVEDALASGAEISWAVYTHELSQTSKGMHLVERLGQEGVPCFLTEAKLLREVSAVETPQGILCAAKMPVYTQDEVIKKAARLLLLDGLQDPGNLGTLFRTALASGMTGIVCMKGSVDPFNPKALRSTMGAVFKIPFLKEHEPEETASLLKQEGIPVFCCDPRADASCYETDFGSVYALVIGNESRGVSQSLLGRCSQKVSIPLSGQVESLNAAVAGAVIMYEALRQNLQRGGVVF